MYLTGSGVVLVLPELACKDVVGKVAARFVGLLVVTVVVWLLISAVTDLEGYS